MLLSGRTLLYTVVCCAACANELVDPPDLAMASFANDREHCGRSTTHQWVLCPCELPESPLT